MLFVLGIADLLAGFIFLALIFKINVTISMEIFFAAYLIIKGGIFFINSMDFGSALDILAGILLIFSIFTLIPVLILILFAAFLILKGLLSILT